MNPETTNQAASPLSALLSSAETLKSVSSVLEVLAGRQGSGGLKIPKDLFDDLPDTDPDQDTAAETAQQVVADADSPRESAINPELLMKLPEIVSAAAPVLSLLGSRSRGTSDFHPFSRLMGSPSDAARRVSLLLALKPYLNEHKCKTVDMLVGVCKLSNIVQKG